MIHPKVFKVSYEDDHHHRTYDGLGDSEYSHTTRKQKSTLVVAPDLETAQFLWTHKWRNLTSITDVRWEEIGDVGLLFSAGYGF